MPFRKPPPLPWSFPAASCRNAINPTIPMASEGSRRSTFRKYWDVTKKTHTGIPGIRVKRNQQWIPGSLHLGRLGRAPRPRTSSKLVTSSEDQCLNHNLHQRICPRPVFRRRLSNWCQNRSRLPRRTNVRESVFSMLCLWYCNWSSLRWADFLRQWEEIRFILGLESCIWDLFLGLLLHPSADTIALSVFGEECEVRFWNWWSRCRWTIKHSVWVKWTTWRMVPIAYQNICDVVVALSTRANLIPWPPEQYMFEIVILLPLVTATQSSWLSTVESVMIELFVELISKPSELYPAGKPLLRLFGASPSELSRYKLRMWDPSSSRYWSNGSANFDVEVFNYRTESHFVGFPMSQSGWSHRFKPRRASWDHFHLHSGTG